jgi:hypothetical protein
MTSEAAMLLWSRQATSAIPRNLLDDTVRNAAHIRANIWLQQAIRDARDGGLPEHMLAHLDNQTDVSASRHERRSTDLQVSRLARRRENRRQFGHAAKNTQDNAARRVVKEKGDFLTLLHLIHVVARQDAFQEVDSERPFAFWKIPHVPEGARSTRKDLGNFLEENLDTTTLTSVELNWGVEYLLSHYSAIFPWIEGGLDLLEEERLRRSREQANEGATASVTEAVRAFAEREALRNWTIRLRQAQQQTAAREASQDSHEEAVRAPRSSPPVTPSPFPSPTLSPASAGAGATSPPPPSYPPPSDNDPANLHGQTVVAPGSSQDSQDKGGKGC